MHRRPGAKVKVEVIIDDDDFSARFKDTPGLTKRLHGLGKVLQHKAKNGNVEHRVGQLCV